MPLELLGQPALVEPLGWPGHQVKLVTREPRVWQGRQDRKDLPDQRGQLASQVLLEQQEHLGLRAQMAQQVHQGITVPLVG